MRRATQLHGVWFAAACTAVTFMMHADARTQELTAPAQAAQSATQRTGFGIAHTGAPINVDLQGADLRTVLRSFAETNGLNMVIDPAVKGTVDVKLTDVPWDQALEIILRNSKLGFVLDGTVIRIAPIEVLDEEQKARLKFTEDQEAAQADDLPRRTYALNYANATKVKAILEATRIVSKYGNVEVDDRTNTLIIHDLQKNLDAVADLLRTLDSAQPQVEIEARIVETDRNSAKSLGVQWGVNGSVSPAIGNTTSAAFPNQGAVAGRVTDDSGAVQTNPGTTTQSAVNLPAQAPNQLATTAIGLSLGAINGAFNLDVALSALEQHGKVHVLSTPHVTTQNNVQAEVTQGTTIPFQTISNNTTSVSFRDAALSLMVTPRITTANTVILDMQLENGSPDFTHTVNGNPTITTQKASTTVMVSDGVTTVIGGVVVNSENVTTDQTPGLSRLPLLGWLFRRNTNTNSNEELLIFITPRIIRSNP